MTLKRLPTPFSGPISEHKSAIWCISVQLAWNRLKNDLVKEPIKLASGQKLAHRLNHAEQSDKDVSSDDYFAMAGQVKDKVIQKIREGLAAKFPQNSMPAIESSPEGVVAFGYVKADVRYQYQFLNSPEWLSFKGGDGRTVPVRAFGLPDLGKKEPITGSTRNQVRFFFRDGGRFALDLSYFSSPNQIILAKLPRQRTLAETWGDLREKIAASPPSGYLLLEPATLLVPNVNWRIGHDFRQLTGADKRFLNAGFTDQFLASVFEFVDFKMDRFGSSVESGAYFGSDLINGHEHEEDTNPNHFHFDRPFLIVMKKRDAKHPFFVMWVDNAELLCKRMPN